MQTQWLLRECFSVVLDGELHLKQLSQLVSTIPVSVGINYLKKVMHVWSLYVYAHW